MASGGSDLDELKRFISSIRLKHVGIAVGVVAVLYGLTWAGHIAGMNVDRTDYTAVAEDYIRSNFIISQKLGKVASLSHYGDGGSAGERSYNVYSVRGENGRGVCYLLLVKRDDKWYVQNGTLSTGGREFNLPVQDSFYRKGFKLFD